MLTLLDLIGILDDLEVSDMFERNFEEPAYVAMCKFEPYPQLKIDLLNLYNL